ELRGGSIKDLKLQKEEEGKWAKPRGLAYSYGPETGAVTGGVSLHPLTGGPLGPVTVRAEPYSRGINRFPAL
ncbi:hypothetical protein V501_09155, partial [Pseudogymnoascus sp. VKM F-4519 (FW-2642)]